MLDRYQRILQAVPLAHVVVHIPGRDNAQPRLIGQPRQRADAGRVAMHQVLLQLDKDVVRAKPGPIARQHGPRCP